VRAGHLPALQVPLDEHGLGHVQEEDVGRGVRLAGPPGLAACVAQLVTGGCGQPVELQLGLAGVWPADRGVQDAPRVAVQVACLAGSGHEAEYQLAVGEVRLDWADPGRAVWAERAEQGHACLVQQRVSFPGDVRGGLVKVGPRRHQ
jgi:hypothetical protein